MNDRLRIFFARMAEKLWVKPLFIGLLSIAVAFGARAMDDIPFFETAPELDYESLEMLLRVLSSSMLVIAVFAVGAMLAAYQSAGNSATPRAFTLVVADDVSQNALSTFVGAFIFSIVAQVALQNGFYDKPSRFILFVITVGVFAIVIIGFIRWVDRIARLGRIGTTIDKVEEATAAALNRRRDRPYMGGRKAQPAEGLALYASAVGYLQRIDMQILQAAAKKASLQVEVACLPGSFITHDRPLAFVRCDSGQPADMEEVQKLARAFCVGRNRTFDDDPRFGLITLSETASRALSPAVNDPGTAIAVLGIYARLFTEYAQKPEEVRHAQSVCDRVGIPELLIKDLFEDAYHATARDGAGTIEVVLFMQKTLKTLARVGDGRMAQAAADCADLVKAHAEKALKVPAELARLHAASGF